MISAASLLCSALDADHSTTGRFGTGFLDQLYPIHNMVRVH